MTAVVTLGFVKRCGWLGFPPVISRWLNLGSATSKFYGKSGPLVFSAFPCSDLAHTFTRNS